MIRSTFLITLLLCSIFMYFTQCVHHQPALIPDSDSITTKDLSFKVIYLPNNSTTALKDRVHPNLFGYWQNKNFDRYCKITIRNLQKDLITMTTIDSTYLITSIGYHETTTNEWVMGISCFSRRFKGPSYQEHRLKQHQTVSFYLPYPSQNLDSLRFEYKYMKGLPVSKGVGSTLDLNRNLKDVQIYDLLQ